MERCPATVNQLALPSGVRIPPSPPRESARNSCVRICSHAEEILTQQRHPSTDRPTMKPLPKHSSGRTGIRIEPRWPLAHLFRAFRRSEELSCREGLVH